MSEPILEVESLDELNRLVVQWGHERQIIENSTAKDQYLKCVSEVGELADAIAKGRHDDLIDAIGDVTVTLIMVAECAGIDLPYCLHSAWNQIKDRTGHLTPDGVFVKDDDQQ